MFKIAVVIVALATGTPLQVFEASDTFDTLAECNAFVAENLATVQEQVKEQSNGQYTIAAKCFNASRREPA